MIDRMLRAAQLKVDLYEEVEQDEGLTSEAFQVVVLVSVLAGLGTALGFLFTADLTGALAGLVIGIVQAVIAWGVWSYATYFVGTKLFGGTATYGELLRSIGYAYSPSALGVVSFIPVLGGLIALVGGVWTLIAGVVAVRQALDFDTGRAIVTILVAFIPAVIVIVVLSLPLAALRVALP